METINNDATTPITSKVSPTAKKTLLVRCILLTIGNCGGPLIMRLYYLHGGERIWLSSCLQTAGWPFIAIVHIILYFHRHANDKSHNNESTKFICMGPRLFFAVVFIGIFLGLDDYLYSYGLARLPVSTSSLIMAALLGFNAFFAYLLVKQKFTPYSINALVLLTIGAGVLAMRDRPEGESKKEYMMGFVITVVAAVLFGFLLPLVELSYNKAKQVITYTLVLEFQMFMSLFATLFCTVGMIINNDFKATNFKLGKTKYYTILCASALIWQCTLLGVTGIIFCASSLLSGIIIAALLPLTEILSVVFYKEKFQVEKGVALGLSLWGFASYFYGEYKLTEKSKQITQSSQQLVDLAIMDYSSV